MAAVSARVGLSSAATGADQAPVVPFPVDERTEDLLVDAAVQGDPSAFAALYDRHFDRVYRHCYYRTGNRADAEDLAQQTFLQAWQAIGRYRRGTTPFIAWLLTISQHLAVSHFRAVREVAPLDVELPAPAARTDPEIAVMNSVAHDAVRSAILQLKVERQQVVILRFIEGFSVAEVAAALGKSENNVRVIQHRALVDLRHLLARPLEERTLISRLRGAVSSAVCKARSSSRRSS
jgi:RNA polymerase sigma-70 factor (ECF subfamily)